jgi:hypothetical protein
MGRSCSNGNLSHQSNANQISCQDYSFWQVLWHKPNLSHLRSFGCATFLHVQKRSKLDPKSLQAIFLGYDEATKAYRCLDYTRQKILISCDVVFNELQLGIPVRVASSFPEDDIFKTFINLTLPSGYPSSSLTHTSTPSVSVILEIPHSPTSFSPISLSAFPVGLELPLQPYPSPVHPSPSPIPLPPHRSLKFRRQNVYLDDYVLFLLLDDFDVCLAYMTPDLVGDNLPYS